MNIGWLSACIDLPAERYDVGVHFWSTVTGSTLSGFRGIDQEFATLIPRSGDPYLRVQRLRAGGGGIHVGLHTDGVAALVRHAARLGAQHVPDNCEHTMMASPGGLAFCVAPHEGEAVRPPSHRRQGAPPSLVDQVCLDITASMYNEEATFWAALTNWDLRRSALAEFSHLDRPAGMPLRIVLQRLGSDDPGAAPRAHLDLACGTAVDDVAADHVTAGAAVFHHAQYWTTMTDTAGLFYCLTRRDPITGTL